MQAHREVGCAFPMCGPPCCAGVDEESVLRVRSQGDAGWHGGQAGDLYITFAVERASGMLREGLDLHSQVGFAALPWQPGAAAITDSRNLMRPQNPIK